MCVTTKPTPARRLCRCRERTCPRGRRRAGRARRHPRPRRRRLGATTVARSRSWFAWSAPTQDAGHRSFGTFRSPKITPPAAPVKTGVVVVLRRRRVDHRRQAFDPPASHGRSPTTRGQGWGVDSARGFCISGTHLRSGCAPLKESRNRGHHGRHGQATRLAWPTPVYALAVKRLANARGRRTRTWPSRRCHRRTRAGAGRSKPNGRGRHGGQARWPASGSKPTRWPSVVRSGWSMTPPVASPDRTRRSRRWKTAWA